MKIIPLNKFDYQIFPINEGDAYIEISEEDFRGLEDHVKCFTDDLMAVIDYVKTGAELLREETERKNEELRFQIYDLKAQLAATDYKTLKYAEGELSEEEYAETKELRKGLREQINQLESQIVEV